jgi:hypothetical protein
LVNIAIGLRRHPITGEFKPFVSDDSTISGRVYASVPTLSVSAMGGPLELSIQDAHFEASIGFSINVVRNVTVYTYYDNSTESYIAVEELTGSPLSAIS